MEKTIATALATMVAARKNCEASGKEEWFSRWTGRINKVMENAPSGAGIDNGTALDLDRSTGEHLVFTFSYHHMNETGMYEGWTSYTVHVKGSLLFGLDIKITGGSADDKDYFHQVYEPWLSEPAPKLE